MFDSDDLYSLDHGLPLIQLKERRREMVIALQNRTGWVTEDELTKIAAIQQAIAAIEAVVTDLDCEQLAASDAISDTWVHSFPAFGRRRQNSLHRGHH